MFLLFEMDSRIHIKNKCNKRVVVKIVRINKGVIGLFDIPVTSFLLLLGSVSHVYSYYLRASLVKFDRSL